MEALGSKVQVRYKASQFMYIYPNATSAIVSFKFVAKNISDLGEEWIITNPVGNQHLVRFNRSFANPLLTLGWSTMIKFYGLQGKHWCVIHLKGTSQFDIVIYKDIIGEIQYNPKPVVDVNPISLNPLPRVLHIDLNLPSIEDDDNYVYQAINEKEPLPVDQDHRLMAPLPIVPIIQPVEEVGNNHQNGTNNLLDGFPLPIPIHGQINPPTVLFYQFQHTMKLSNYMVYGCQYLPRSVCDYLRLAGVNKWTLRGPGGIQVKVTVVAPIGRRNVKFGKGWKLFLSVHALSPGDVVTLKFTNPVLKMVHVDFVLVKI